MSRRFLVSLAALAALSAAPRAQAAGETRSVHVAPLFGAWIPIGHAQQDFDSAPLAGLQLSYDAHPNVAIVGTFSWAATNAKQLSSAALDVLQYDLGMRAQQGFALGSGATLRPYLGVGVGQTRYSFRDGEETGGPGFAFYSSAGVDLGYRALTAGFTFRHQMQSVDADSLGTSPVRQNLELFTSVGLRF